MSDAWKGLDLGLDSTPTSFTGYDKLDDEAKILAIVADDERRETVGQDVNAIFVLDKTPFYAEMGGQTGDHGVIRLGDSIFTVNDVKKDKASKYLHYGVVTAGSFTTGDAVSAQVDVERRRAIMRAHSATHLLQKALVSVLGDHVHQAGSLVEPDHLRFDFTHYAAMTPAEVAETERIVNESILLGYSIAVNEMPIEEARKLGATALFGEKYGDTVRVVDMGGYSVEFCGGNHLDNTAKVGPFIITSEFSVASGVRRIEAVTGLTCMETMRRNRELIFTVAETMKTRPEELLQKTVSRNEEMQVLRRELEKLQDKLRAGEIDTFLASAKDVGGIKVVTAVRPGATADDLRKMGDFLRDKSESVVAVLAASEAEKITFLAVCGKEAIARGIKAGDIIRQVTAICGGKGGGRPDSAMGGGKDLLMLDNALSMVDNIVAMKLGLK